MRLIGILVLLACGCAASTTEDEHPASGNPTLDAGGPKITVDANSGWSADSTSTLAIDAGSASCTPGEVVGTAHIVNTCYLDCLNACMACDSPTGEAECGDFNHPGHAPYCGIMTFIVCPPGSHSERTFADTATQYFPGTQHYANETYSCICDEYDGGIAR